MNIEQHTISKSDTVRHALERLNKLSGGPMTLFAIDAEGRVAGSLTDGDIRRALIAGRSMDDSLENVAHTQFRYLSAEIPDVAEIRTCRNLGLRLLPVVDNGMRLVDIIDLSERHTLLLMDAILMAGGKGERLRPLTLDTPKPLLEIEGKAIIDYNIESLSACGIKRITVATGYLAHMIEEHFAEKTNGPKVRCVREEKPLGTIGAVSLADIPENGLTLVMNSDLLTTISFEDMYLHHLSSGADITIAVIPYQVSVPYAILTIDTQNPDLHKVAGIEEKPSFSFYANAGIYIFSNDILRNVPPGRRVDATDLISEAIASGRRTTYFPIKGTWIDIGSPVDFRQAAELMKHHRSMSAEN